MKFVRAGLTAIAFGALGIACTQPATETITQTPIVATSPVPAASADEFATARANFAKHCNECHGERGDGGLVKVEGKSFKVPSLREGHAVTHTDDRLMKQVREGEDEMPAFKDKLSEQEMADLVRFVRKEFQGK